MSETHYNPETEDRCSVVLNKGNICNRLVKEGVKTCKLHSGRYVLPDNEVGCQVIVLRGPRKNKPCNRPIIEGGNFCRSHQVLENNKPYNPYVDHESEISFSEVSNSIDLDNLHPRLKKVLLETLG